MKNAGMLIRYNAACEALAIARSTDEVKEIRNQSEALRAYAIQAKNRQLEIDAGEIRLRAERRLGELIRTQKESTGLNRGQLLRGTRKEPREEKPTLSEAGIDKKLSARSQQLAAIPGERFESMLGDWRGRVERETERVTVNLLKAGQRQQRRDSARASDPPIGKYSTIVIDPPWSYANNSGRQANDYSQVMTLEQVAAFDIGGRLSKKSNWIWILSGGLHHAYLPFLDTASNRGSHC